MLVIGGMGTMYGAVIGASLFVFAQSYLQDGLHLIHETVGGPLALLFEPDRWLLWLGILFVVSVYYFPTGIADGSGNWRSGDKRRACRAGGHGSRLRQSCCACFRLAIHGLAARYFTRLRTSSTLRFTSSTRRCRSSILRLLELRCCSILRHAARQFLQLVLLAVRVAAQLVQVVTLAIVLRPPSPCLRSSADSFAFVLPACGSAPRSCAAIPSTHRPAH